MNFLHTQVGGCTRGRSPLVGGAAAVWRRGGNAPAPAFPFGGNGKGDAASLLPQAKRIAPFHDVTPGFGRWIFCLISSSNPISYELNQTRQRCSSICSSLPARLPVRGQRTHTRLSSASGLPDLCSVWSNRSDIRCSADAPDRDAQTAHSGEREAFVPMLRADGPGYIRCGTHRNAVVGRAGFWPAEAVSCLSVRCMRSCRPFCCGLPGSMRSGVMPSLIHHTASPVNPLSPLLPNGAPLSVRILAGKPYSRKAASNTGLLGA